jgi:hypothetical protein
MDVAAGVPIPMDFELRGVEVYPFHPHRDVELVDDGEVEVFNLLGLAGTRKQRGQVEVAVRVQQQGVRQFTVEVSALQTSTRRTVRS